MNPVGEMIQKLRRWCERGGFPLAVAFSFSLIWLWSSGYKDAVTWGAFLFAIGDAIRRRERISFGGLGLPILAYLVCCAISSARSIHPVPNWSWRHYYKLIELVAGFIAIVNLLRRGRRAETAARAVAFAFVFVWLADGTRLLVNLLMHTDFMTDGRWNGSRFNFPTIAAAVHAAGFVFVVALLLLVRGAKQRVALAAGLALCCAILMSLQTRSVILGIAAGLVVLLASLSEERKRAFAIIGIAGAIFAAVMFGSPAVRTRILSGGFSDRLAIWHDVMLAIKDEPRMGCKTGYGYGHGILKPVYKRVINRKRMTAKTVLDHAHNMELELLLQTGWPGLVAWLALLATAAWRTLRAVLRETDATRRWAIAAVAAALASLVVYGQFSAFFALAPIFLFWNLLGLLAALTAPRTEPPAA